MNIVHGAAKGGGAIAYRIGWFMTALAMLTTVWTTIVRDDGSGSGNFMIVLAAAASAFAAGSNAAALARAMLGVAAMTVAMGILMATDPSTPHVERALLWSGVLTLMWLGSAVSFYAQR